MTIQEFRSYPNCDHYSDQQAKEIIQTLENLAVILFDFTCQKNGIIIDNQLVINDNSQENSVISAA